MPDSISTPLTYTNTLDRTRIRRGAAAINEAAGESPSNGHSPDPEVVAEVKERIRWSPKPENEGSLGDYDLELLGFLPDPETWAVLRVEKFNPDLIVDPKVRDIYDFAADYRREYDQVATEAVLTAEFDGDDLTFTQPTAALGWLLEEMRERWIRNRGRDSLKAAAEQFRKDPSQTLPTMKRTVNEWGDVLNTGGSVCAADVPMRYLRWVWDGWMPVGYCSLVTGVSTIGKSIFACWLVAELTHGRLDGEFKGEPSKVLLVTNEDGQSDMWGPRLLAAGADLDRVDYLRYGRSWNLRDGIDLIEREVRERESKLVYIDCTLEHLPSAKAGESTYNAAYVRSSLAPLKEMIQRLNVGCVLSLHPPKAKGSSFADWVAGSAAWVQATRTGLLFGEHPEDRDLAPQERRRVIVSPAESRNVGAEVGSLEFSIQPKTLKIEGRQIDTPVITEPITSGVSFEDMMGWSDREPTKKESIRDLVDAYLGDGEWHEALTDHLEAEGYTAATISRATKGFIEKKKTGKTWLWRKKVA